MGWGKREYRFKPTENIVLCNTPFKLIEKKSVQGMHLPSLLGMPITVVLYCTDCFLFLHAITVCFERGIKRNLFYFVC